MEAGCGWQLGTCADVTMGSLFRCTFIFTTLFTTWSILIMHRPHLPFFSLFFRALTVVIVGCGGLAAAQITTTAGEVVPYDSIDFDPSQPRMAYGIKHGNSIRMLTLDEVDRTTLPADMQATFDTYATEQKALGIILYGDEWVDRNELLLKSDERFGYDSRLRRAGPNKLIVHNKYNEKVTLGLRYPKKNQGTEFSVPAGEKKTLTYIPNGDYQMYSVYEADNGVELIVIEEKPVSMNRVHFTLTYDPANKQGTTGHRRYGRHDSDSVRDALAPIHLYVRRPTGRNCICTLCAHSVGFSPKVIANSPPPASSSSRNSERSSGLPFRLTPVTYGSSPAPGHSD